MTLIRLTILSSALILILISGPFFKDLSMGQDTERSKLHIYALRYGQSRFKLKDIYLSEKNSKSTEFVWLFYLVTLENRKILIDTGFSNDNKASYYRLTEYTHPTKLLSQLGIKPDDITDVIITHKHFDHSGLIYLYRNADIYIQKEAYQSLLYKRSGMQPAGIPEFLKTSRLIQVMKGDYSISSSIDIRKSGGHTKGSQLVLLKTKKAPIIFTGDECYFIEGCLNTRINSHTENRQNNLSALVWMKTAVKNKSATLLSFHDPVICRSYPQIHKNIFQIQ
ncbi:MAG: N-acyl homoserine lactonase family protein [Deltaproteobacteria bacterium]|nr:N-acyl homoserine lactonase family protein [Deltaproteobacteria bacterium]